MENFTIILFVVTLILAGYCLYLLSKLNAQKHLFSKLENLKEEVENLKAVAESQKRMLDSKENTEAKNNVQGLVSKPLSVVLKKDLVYGKNIPISNYDSVRKAELDTGVSRTTISKSVRKKCFVYSKKLKQYVLFFPLGDKETLISKL